MSVTTRDGLLEAWATQIEAMEQNLEALYGPPQGTPTLPSVTTHEGLLEAIETEIQNAYVNYAKVYGAYHSNTYAYKLTLPSHLMDWYGVKKVGGRSVVMNQIVQNGDFTDGATGWSGNQGTVSAADGVLAYTIGSTIGNNSYTNIVKKSMTVPLNHVYYVSMTVKLAHTVSALTGYVIGGTNKQFNFGRVTGGSWQKVSMIFTKEGTGDGTTLQILCRNASSAGYSAGEIDYVRSVNLIDLTQMFGAGNEPATSAEAEAMFPAEYYDYDTGTLMNCGVTDIVFKDGNTVKKTYSVPAAVKALTGYGVTCPNGTNYIDFETKKFYQYVGTRAFASGDDTDSTVITDGTNTNYKLTTPVETDISSYLTELPDADVRDGWDIIFKNQNGDNYCIPVPVQVDFIGTYLL